MYLFTTMLYEDAQLSHTIFSKSIHEEATRDGYGKGLIEAGQSSSVVVLSADVEESTRCHWFRSIYPDRFIECGVAEQHMAALAAGLSMVGKIPFIHSYATFSPGRNWEQIRTTIAYNNANVKIAGHHVGVSTGPDGATHQALEDIALMRVLPHMSIIYPGDAIEAQKAVVYAAQAHGPMYIRLHRHKTPVFTTHQTSFRFGAARVLWVPSHKIKKPHVAIFSTGPLTYTALQAVRLLEQDNIHAVLLHFPTIKPLDEDTLCMWAKKAGAVVTVEEHSIHGGFGSAVSEVLSQRCPVPCTFVGVHDEFGQSGNASELLNVYNMEAKDIVRAAKKSIKLL